MSYSFKVNTNYSTILCELCVKMNNKPFNQVICILWYSQAPPPGVCKCVQETEAASG